jgi:uncharacterized SAM-binding protein YcdF (DUF218 family)
LTSAAALVHFALSSGGVLIVLSALGVWMMVRPASRRARRTFAGVALAYAIAGSYPVPRLVGTWLARPFRPLTAADVPPGKTAVVLLGSGAYTQHTWAGDTMSVLDRVGAERTLEAARIFRLVNPVWLISSGGRVIADDPDETAGVVMKEALVHLGVPEPRILVEQQSRTTRDEAVVVKSMLAPLAIDHLVLVTSDTHMRRSMAVFRSVGLDAIPAIAMTSPHVPDRPLLQFIPSQSGLEEADEVIHELLGLGYYWLRGWQK